MAVLYLSFRRNRQTRSSSVLSASFAVLISSLRLSAPVLGSLKLSSKWGKWWRAARYAEIYSKKRNDRALICGRVRWGKRGKKKEKACSGCVRQNGRLSISRSCFVLFFVRVSPDRGRLDGSHATYLWRIWLTMNHFYRWNLDVLFREIINLPFAKDYVRKYKSGTHIRVLVSFLFFFCSFSMWRI